MRSLGSATSWDATLPAASSWSKQDAAPHARLRLSVAQAIAAGLAIVAAQVAMVLALAPGATLAERYVSLCQWDGWQYANIAEHGYHSTVPPVPNDIDRANVAFFPGYPLLAGAVSRACHVSVPVALVLTAQMAAWGFWTYWLLLLMRCRAPRATAAAGTLLLAAHPGAYFLVVSYSESLFLLGVCGYLYWIAAERRGSTAWAVAQGMIMTGTRIAGLPLAFCPLLAALVGNGAPADDTSFSSGQGRGRQQFRLVLVAAAASLGGLAFFAYCQWRFGAWDLYLQAQRIGWQVSPNYLWWLEPTSYVFFASLVYPNALWPDDVSRLCTLLTVAACAALAVCEVRAARRGDTQWRGRLVYYTCAAVLFYVHASGVSPIVMKSMLRYSLGAHALLLLAMAQASGAMPSVATRIGRALARTWWLAVPLFALQAALAWRFLHVAWVA
ncbi:MAG: hypothetical protein AB7O59_17005 [Pirellulales bacterium]